MLLVGHIVLLLFWQVVESLGGAVVGSVDKATHIVAQKVSFTTNQVVSGISEQRTI